jgi:ATP-dependent Clp protease adapter protein ClpS
VSDWSVVGAGLAFVLALWAAFARLRAPKADPASMLAFEFATAEAIMRGHGTVSIDHAALALLFDPTVAEMVRAAGGDPSSIRRQLDEHLGAVKPPAASPVPPTFDEDLRTIMSRAVTSRRTMPVDALVTEIARRSESVAGALLPAAHALAKVAVRRRSALIDCDREQSSAYRSDRVFAGDTQVRIFDNKKTSFEHVHVTLTETFGLTAACARYVTLRVHERGSAAIGPWSREEAAKLVTKASHDARAAGEPLRFEIGPTSK